jgi:hypothetical protein
MIGEHDVFILLEDLNPNIIEGMRGVCLQVYPNKVLVEFVKKDGTNYEYQGQEMFTIKKDLVKVTWSSNEN